MRTPLPLAVSVALVACGSNAKSPSVVVPPSDAGASSATIAAPTPPPSGLPPLAPMPPAGVVGSKKAKQKTDGALFACLGTKPSGDVADAVKRLGEACAAASKMKPLGNPMRGRQADKDAHQEHKVHVEAGHCYRVYFAADESIKDVVVVARDSSGDIVAESPGPALPLDGTMCFTSADDLTLLMGVGMGSGNYALQVWSD